MSEDKAEYKVEPVVEQEAPEPLQLVDDNHPFLSTVLEEFDFNNPPEDPIQLAHKLAATMTSHGGMGLSANQVGLPYRVFTMATSPITTCFNPRIVDQGDEQILLDEGCLSFPGLLVKIKRVKSIKVRFTLPNGEVKTEKYSGITARVFLHELDHMNGVKFISRAGTMAKSVAIRKWSKLKKINSLKKKLGYK